MFPRGNLNLCLAISHFIMTQGSIEALATLAYVVANGSNRTVSLRFPKVFIEPSLVEYRPSMNGPVLLYGHPDNLENYFRRALPIVIYVSTIYPSCTLSDGFVMKGRY